MNYIDMCPYCELDSAGRHQIGCPNYKPINTVTISQPSININNLLQYHYLEKELAERSREKQNKESELEIELARYKQEAEKIPKICPRIYTKTQKGLVSCIYKGCPQICPNWRGGGEK